MVEQKNTHERLADSSEVKTSSDRGFGIVFCIVFLLIGLWPLIGGGAPRWWGLGVAGAFLAAAFLCPGILRPFNRLWTAFGLLLHKVVNPLVMGMLFFLVVFHRRCYSDISDILCLVFSALP